jgi:type IV pilus assembly protein PilX
MDVKFNVLSRQRGVVLIFALLVLLILAIGSVAVLRSVNNSLTSSGNLAFHRDLVNQAELAVATVMTEFKTNALPLGGVTTASLVGANYSAQALPTNPQGVPTALLDDTIFATVGTAANDLVGATADVKIRYVIDRLCNAAGGASSPHCVQSSALPTGGSTPNLTSALLPPSATVYRVSVRVSGPRQTQAFLQTTFTKPD